MGSTHSRVVLFKSSEEQGLAFYTNYRSRKARDIGENPRVSICFHWSSSGRQINIDGIAEKVSAHRSDEYFAKRSRGSKIGAWVSGYQSQPLTPEMTLEERFLLTEREFEGKEVPRPEYWGGFMIRPLRVEFWQDGKYRLHHRELFDCSQTQWSEKMKYEILSP